LSGWRYVITPRAERDFRRLDQLNRGRVLEALDRYVEAPSQGDVRKLHGGQAEWRLRIGNVRVRFRRDVGERLIVVVRVLPRGRAYRD
jgi:mRNA-degrading endonuclease RelE of RelBE toxin-antitoxin system